MDVGLLILSIIGFIVSLIFSLNTVETVVEAVEAINTTGWTFTGHQGATAMLGLIPFGYIAGVAVLGIVGGVMAYYKFVKD